MTRDQSSLIDVLEGRLEYLVNDCRTLFRVRHDHHDWLLKNGRADRLGGGNFLVGIGLLSALNFAAKLHRWLIEPNAFATKTDSDTVKEAVRTLLKDPMLKPILKCEKTKWKPPRNGDCNEKEAFIKLVKALRPDISLGLDSDKDAGEVWGFFRNSLAHMAWPKGAVVVIASQENSSGAEVGARQGPKAFWREEYSRGHYGWYFNVDRLMFDMDDIVKWLKAQVESCADDSRIAAALRWIQQEHA